MVISNIVSADFLHGTFNLTTETYKPFRKPNNALKYINIDSHHSLQSPLAKNYMKIYHQKRYLIHIKHYKKNPLKLLVSKNI